jgi:hypothetical protein
MQRPNRVAASQLLVGCVGELQTRRVVELADNRIEGGIEALDLREKRRHHLSRRQLPGSKLCRKTARAGKAQRVGPHSHFVFLKR